MIYICGGVRGEGEIFNLQRIRYLCQLYGIFVLLVIDYLKHHHMSLRYQPAKYCQMIYEVFFLSARWTKTNDAVID